MSQSITQAHREFDMPPAKRAKWTKKAPAKRATRKSTALRPQATSRWVKTPKAYVNYGYALPKRVENTHRYYTAYLANPAAASTTKSYFRANGMYDPDVAVGGHQPMLFDQLGAMYNHFTVIESRIKVTFSSEYLNSVSNLGSCVCVLSVDDNASDTRAYGDIIETDANAKWGVFGPGAEPLTLTTDWKASDFFGGDIIDNPNFRGNTGADPTEQSVYVITVVNQSGTYQVYLYVNVLIEYRAVWSELKDIVAS